MRKLVKAWNKLPVGAAVTTDPLQQVVLVDKERLAHLEREGHFGAPPAREIPAEVKTGSAPDLHVLRPTPTAIKPSLLPDKTATEEP